MPQALPHINEKPQRKGDYPYGGTTDTRVFQVIVDGPNYYPSQIKSIIHSGGYSDNGLAMPGITYGTQHPASGSFANSFSAEQQSDSRDHWLVTVTYGIEPIEDPQDPNLPDLQYRDPLLDPPEVEWLTKQREVVADKNTIEFEGNEGVVPVLNFARRPYDPPLTYWEPGCVLRVTRNEANATFASLAPYLGKTNSAVFLGAAVDTVLCSDIQARKGQRAYRADNNVPLAVVTFWRVSYEFEYIDETDPVPDSHQLWYAGPHNPFILQADFEQVNAAGDGTEPILDDNGDPVRTPWPIGFDGRAIPKDQLPEEAVYKGHRIRKQADFNQLNFQI